MKSLNEKEQLERVVNDPCALLPGRVCDRRLRKIQVDVVYASPFLNIKKTIALKLLCRWINSVAILLLMEYGWR